MRPISVARRLGADDAGRPARGRGEDGFTLAELVVAMIILAVIGGPLVAAMMIGLSSTGAAASRLNVNTDRQLVAIYAGQDIANANYAAVGNSSGTVPLTSACATQSGQPGAALTDPQVVLVLSWAAATVNEPASGSGPPSFSYQDFEVDYVLAQSAGHPPDHPNQAVDVLWRYYYSGVAAKSTCGGSPLASKEVAAYLSTTNGAIGTPLGASYPTGSAALTLTDYSGATYGITGEART
jgi:prepilin-type N-terminal cleavage/methylation domain-containing protein